MFGSSLLGKGVKASGVDLTDDLVAYWPLDTDSDDAYASYDGTDTDITYAGGFASFNGSSSEIDTTLTLSGGTHTLSFWVDLDSTDDSKVVLDSGGIASANNGYILITSGGKLRFAISNGANILALDIETTDASLTHYAISWDNTTNADAVKIYKDGSNIINGTATGSISGAHTSVLIFGYANDTYHMAGDLSNIRVYDAVKDQTFITALYDEGS